MKIIWRSTPEKACLPKVLGSREKLVARLLEADVRGDVTMFLDVVDRVGVREVRVASEHVGNGRRPRPADAGVAVDEDLVATAVAAGQKLNGVHNLLWRDRMLMVVL